MEGNPSSIFPLATRPLLLQVLDDLPVAHCDKNTHESMPAPFRHGSRGQMKVRENHRCSAPPVHLTLDSRSSLHLSPAAVPPSAPP